MTLDQWLDHATSLHHQEIDLGLVRIHSIAKTLNIIQLPFPVITIAGTNGKGSTVTFLESIYRQQGYTVCAVTSPHLLKFNERLRINGKDVDDARLCAAFEKVEQARGNTTLTYFEFTHLGLMIIIKEMRPHVAILEIGLGGRLDAVNITEPHCAVITSISLDHTDKLGSTREAIGFEKAGILRKNLPFVCGEIDPPKSIIQCAKQQHCKSYYAGHDFLYEKTQKDWSWKTASIQYSHLTLPSLPLQNASTALMTATVMQPLLPVSELSIFKGIAGATLQGRFQKIQKIALHIIDVAHNPESSALLAENIVSENPTGKVIAVFSILKDKDIGETLKPMLPVVTHWFIAPIEHVERASSIEYLYEAFPDKDCVTKCASLQEAQRCAQALATEKDMVVTFGSFYTAKSGLQ